MCIKAELRREMAVRRQNLLDRSAKEKKVTDKLLKMCEPFNKIFIYVSIGSELNTKPVIEALMSRNKAVMIPYTPIGGMMRPVLLTSAANLTADKRGNLKDNFTETETEPDLVVVPMLAFNEDLYRLGYGGGYYDRYLGAVAALKVGVAFDEQYCRRLKAEPFDIALDVILTPDKILCKDYVRHN